MSLEAWLLFCATETLLCLTPGPAVLLVVSLGVARGAGTGIRAGLGVLTANALHFGLAASGVAALLVGSWQLFFALKWLGALYLAWLALGMLRGRRADPARRRLAAARRAGLRHGFVTQAANPKSLLFFTAILPQFIDPAAPAAAQIALLGATSLAIECAVLCGYASLAARGRRALRAPRARRWLERAAGALLLAAATRLASLRRGSEAPAALLP